MHNNNLNCNLFYFFRKDREAPDLRPEVISDMLDYSRFAAIAAQVLRRETPHV